MPSNMDALNNTFFDMNVSSLNGFHHMNENAFASHTGFVPNISTTVGDTPLVELKKLNKNPLARIFVKVEFLNPTGSIKDRIARHMINQMEEIGILKPGSVIVENSSGNTAAAVAMVASQKGYKAVIIVPSSCSEEKQNAVRAYGAQLIVSPSDVSPDHPEYYANIARRLQKEIPNSVYLDQYNNQLNVEAHYSTTGPEIWAQTKGKLDIFVAAASTGGTISGVGRYLKKASNGRVKIVLADPQGSCLYNYFKNGIFEPLGEKTQVEGIGKNEVVQCMKFDVIDDAVQVTDIDSLRTARLMATQEGILCGGSSGANVYAALCLAEKCTEPTNIVTVLPDTGTKYLSKFFNPEWLLKEGLITQEEVDEHKPLSCQQLIDNFKAGKC